MTSSSLAALLECEPTTTTLVGVEREYRVLEADMQPIDFRPLIATLSLPGGNLDPGDPNAHHLPSGVLLTADGPEAEAAIPPIPLGPGFTWRVTSWAEHSEDALVAALPAGSAIEGYSTHLNVSVGADVVPVADLFARHFALGMMLLLDQADSPGLLVRPRPGRLELGGDFVDGEQLRVALTYAAAAARACVTALNTGSSAALPPPMQDGLEHAKDRPGWFIALHPVERGALANAWHSARAELLNLTSPDELIAVDDVVDGRRPLPQEQVCGPDRKDDARESPFASLHSRDRGDLHVGTRAVSWAAVAFNVRSGRHEFHLVIPRRWLRSFLEQLDAGALDEALATAKPTRHDETGPQIVHGAFDPRWVVPPEPHVRRSWFHDRRPELIGAGVGSAAVAGMYRLWLW